MKKIMDKINDLLWYSNEFQLREVHELALEIKSELEDLSKRSIEWTIQDFEVKAEENEGYYNKENIYDRSKFKEALENMINSHDASKGISWDDVDENLNNYCKFE